MNSDLKLRVLLQLADKALGPLKNIRNESSATARALTETRERLKQLNRQQSAIDGALKQQQALRESSNRLRILQQNLASVSQTYGSTSAQAAKAQAAVDSGKAAWQKQAQQVARLRAELTRLGIGKIGEAQARLKGDIESATAAMKRQGAELARLAARDARLAEMRERHVMTMMHTGVAIGAGVAVREAGQAGVRGVLGASSAFSEHEQAMLGIARQVPGARAQTGELTDVYRKMEQQVRELSTVLPYTTVQIAEMTTAAARMEVPTDQLRNFVYLASAMATAFDAVPDEIAESMGKVAKNFKIPLTQIEGLADAINYLDDNAISKGGDIIDFLNRTSGVLSTVAMSGRDAAALGSTLLTLGERTETAGTAANAIIQKFAAATHGTKKMQQAMADAGISATALERGMQSDATGTLLEVIEKIRKLPKNQQVGVMVRLVGLEHSDTLAKLVDKPDELRRQLALAASTQAQGSMRREFSARTDTQDAQWQITKNQVFNIAAALGETLKPMLIELMSMVNRVLGSLGRWMQAHPALVAGIMKTALVVSAFVAALGAIIVPIATIVGGFFALRFGIQFATALMPQLATALSMLSAPLRWLGTGLSLLGRGVMFLGRALLLNPVGLAITAIVVAGYMLWRNWDGIVGGLKALWEDLSSFAARIWAALVAGWNRLTTWLTGLRDTWASFGADIIEGLVNGITGAAGRLWSAVTGIAQGAADRFKSLLGIKSPSRVFLEAGQNIGEGAARGIGSRMAAVRQAALGLASATAVALPAMAATPALDSRPPIRPAAPSSVVHEGGSVYQITIQAAPGMDPQDIARAVRAELDRRDAEKQARRRSALTDHAD